MLRRFSESILLFAVLVLLPLTIYWFASAAGSGAESGSRETGTGNPLHTASLVTGLPLNGSRPLARLEEADYVYYSKRVEESGELDYEHSYSYDTGGVSFVATGQGDIVGYQGVMTKKAPGIFAVNIQESYYATTAVDALNDEYALMISRFTVDRDHQSTAGIQPKPGSEGTIDQSVASSRDGRGDYLKTTTELGTPDGTTRMISEVGRSRSRVDVEGFSAVREKHFVSGGGERTGWWDIGMYEDAEDEDEDEDEDE